MIAIAAMDRNHVIGHDGRIPWRLPEDMKFFKNATTGHVILMGRKTFESLGRLLPGREHWVVSRGADFEGARMFRSFDEVPDQSGDGREIFVIGGAQAYEALLPRCEAILLTIVPGDHQGDTFFPRFDDQFTRSETLQETPELRIERWVRTS